MSYNIEEFPKFAKAAGRISILAAVAGFCVFLLALMVDVGQQEFQRVSAQGTATTSLTVLNTPPAFVQGAYEITESSTTTPTNSGTTIEWSAIGSDSNGAPYFLLVCSTNASPTANAAADNLNLGTAPPTCGGGVQWGVSTATVSGAPAFVSTTTVETADNPATQFGESNSWFAWVCDDDPVQPACNLVPTQGLSATNSSPFNMNQRPVLTNFYNDGGVDPGGIINFFSTSTDPDTVVVEDTLTLIVCQTNSNYSTTTNTCANQLATSTYNPTANATSSYTLGTIVRDGSYPAFAYLIDSHGHEASAPLSQPFIVNNVAPSIAGGDIDLNGGSDISLVVPGSETTGFNLDFIVSDANSCINSSGATSSEITGFEVSVLRSGIGTSSCDAAAADYNPNNCYTSGVATSTWDLTCTASTTSCTGITDDTQVFNCTFPLWFVADATDQGAVVATDSPFEAEYWMAAIRGVDDNFATGTQATNTSQVVDMIQFPAIDLQTAEIPYGALAPGDSYSILGGAAGTTTSNILNVGNTGLDQEVQGESMCGTFSATSTCAVSASSTIPEFEQEFSSTTIAYGSPQANILSSSTAVEVELDVNKTTATSTPSTGTTYWGIAVPASITVAGSYQGLNTFTAATAETADW